MWQSLKRTFATLANKLREECCHASLPDELRACFQVELMRGKCGNECCEAQ